MNELSFFLDFLVLLACTGELLYSEPEALNFVPDDVFGSGSGEALVQNNNVDLAELWNKDSIGVADSLELGLSDGLDLFVSNFRRDGLDCQSNKNEYDC